MADTDTVVISTMPRLDDLRDPPDGAWKDLVDKLRSPESADDPQAAFQSGI